MAKLFTVGSPAKAKGKLYLVYMWVDGEDTPLVKVGVTKNTIMERVCSILTSFWNVYRYIPKTYPKRFKECEDVYGKEAMMHRYLSDKKYTFQKPFSGSTEYFYLDDEEDLLAAYERCMKGEDLNARTSKEDKETESDVNEE